MDKNHISRSSVENPSGSPGKQPLERFRIAGWIVDPATSRVSRGDQIHKLEPRVMELLVYLAHRPGEVVTREELEDSIWKGTIVGYNSVTGAIQKLRKVFDDDPRHSRVIETLSKRGYRMIATVHPDETAFESDARQGTHTELVPTKNPWLHPGLLASLVLVIGITGAYIWINHWQDTRDMAVTDSTPKSIAVMPFDNLGGNSGQEYFVDGITDDLITELAKNPELLVISRESTFLYKHQPLDIREIADELDVRYVLHGSIRREGERLRINVQLLDTDTGGHLWAEGYDTQVANIFKWQDDVTRKVFSILITKASIGEQQDLGTPHTSNFQAYDSFLIGRQKFYLFSNKENNQNARELFQKAIEFDPEFAMAYAMLAWTHVFDVMNGWSPAAEDSLTRARGIAEKATSLQKVIPVAYFVKGLTYREQGEYMSALVEAEKAIEHDPNYANAHVLLATLLYYAGRPEEGLERMKKAIQINPHHPYNYTFHLGQAYYILHRYEEAIDAFRHGISSNPTSARLHLWLAATYAQINDIDKAKWEVEQILILDPEFSLDQIQQTFPFKHQSDRTHFINGLRKAGLS